VKSQSSMKIDVKQLPLPGQFAEVENAPEGYAAVLQAITAKRYKLKLTKKARGEK